MQEKILAYIETIESAKVNSIENQEQENNEEFFRGKEEAYNYALEMLAKHLSD